MKTNTLFSAATLAAAAGIFSTGYAQAPGSAQLAATAAATAPANPLPAPDASKVVYSPRLPSAQELSNAAAAQGVSIERIEQSPSQTIVVYRDGAGQLTTVVYQVLPQPNATSVTVATPTTPPPVILYQPATRVYYDYSPGYYDSWYWYPRVSVGVGFGYPYYRGGWYRGGNYRGGGYHGGGYRGGGHPGGQGGHR